MKIAVAISCFALAIAAARVGSLIQQAPQTSVNISNPLEGSEQARRAGAKLYPRECSSCHGKDRSGLGKAPPLNTLEVYKSSPGALFWVLRNGSLERGMPSFAHLPEPQRWQIVTYLQKQQAEGDAP